MKKRIVFCAICMCVFVLCSGCGERAAEKQTAGRDSLQTAGEDGLVTMSAELTDDEKNTIVTGSIFNKTEKDIQTGDEYTLQVLKDGSFVDVPPLSSVAWNLVGINISSGSERSHREDLGIIYGDLEAGRYRIVKKYCYMNGSKREENADEETVTAEFDLP